MNSILKLLYKVLPDRIVRFLGRSTFLKGFRNKLLRPQNKEVITREEIIWECKKFGFYAPVRMAVKAKKKGIENKLIRTSIQLIHRLDKNNPVVLDVGSNYGFVSLALQTHLPAESSIYAFEPHPDIFKAFSQSIQFNNFNNIFLFNNAVGNETKEIELNLYGQSSNILKKNLKQQSSSIPIGQLKLDEFLKEKNMVPDYIKIDVDGYELEVLKGLSETIKNYKPILVVEPNEDRRVIDFLIANNYTLLDADLKAYNSLIDNIFCINND